MQAIDFDHAQKQPTQQPSLYHKAVPQMPNGYYAAGPNPNLARFMQEHATPYDPANPATAADWLRQCRRAGLYDLGRAIYEKGGIPFSSLSEEAQVEVEEEYQICVRRS